VLDAVILAGGNSSRFGSNKMLFAIDGMPMAARVASNLCELGQVLLIGASTEVANSVSIDTYIGPREGQGPLGALVDAMYNCKHNFLLVSPCDTPFFEKQDFARLVEALTSDFDVAVAHDVRNHWLLSCWNVSSSVKHLDDQFSGGERAIHRAVVGLRVVEVQFSENKTRNINTPKDLSNERKQGFQ
jgi:molybdopterin-guanine dinucleotide biosynthesis protein A